VQTFCRKRKLQSRSPYLALAGDTGGRRQQREGMFTEGRTYEIQADADSGVSLGF